MLSDDACDDHVARYRRQPVTQRQGTAKPRDKALAVVVCDLLGSDCGWTSPLTLYHTEDHVDRQVRACILWALTRLLSPAEVLRAIDEKSNCFYCRVLRAFYVGSSSGTNAVLPRLPVSVSCQ